MGTFGAISGADGTEYAASASGSVNHSGSEDCAGVYYGDTAVDECGVCGGSGIADGSCDCDGNVEDCAGTCDGDAFINEDDECVYAAHDPISDLTATGVDTAANGPSVELTWTQIVSGDADEIMKSEKIILPGVGNFKKAIQKIRESGFENILKKKVVQILFY